MDDENVDEQETKDREEPEIPVISGPETSTVSQSRKRSLSQAEDNENKRHKSTDGSSSCFG